MENEYVNIFKSKVNTNWHYILIAAIVVAVLILIYFREKFGEFQKDLPYTAGSNIRYSSIDSASDRGTSQNEY